MSSDGNFVLRWDLHEETRTSTLKSLWKNEDFLDVTIACDDDQIDAHKVILSAASPFFENILKRNPHGHPLLYLRGTVKKDVLALLDFIYSGETQVLQEDLDGFMALANSLEVKGLIGDISAPKQKRSITKTKYQINIFDKQNSRNKQLLEEEDCKSVEKEVQKQIKHEKRNKKKEVELEENFQIVELPEERKSIIFEENQIKPKNKKKEVKTEEEFQILELTEGTENVISEANESLQYENTPNTSMTEYNEKKSELVTRTENGCWTCTVCSYVSKNRGHALEHTERHIEGFSLECTNCEKTFRTNKTLRQHVVKCVKRIFGKNYSF